MKIKGRDIIVVLDDLLFDGGPGEIVRRKLRDNFDVQTVLRLQTEIFPLNGLIQNVLFIGKKTELWKLHKEGTDILVLNRPDCREI